MKRNVCYYHIPGQLKGRIYVEDLDSKQIILDEEPFADDLNKRLDEICKMYPDATKCEFKY